MSNQQTVFKTGNSLTVSLPTRFVSKLGITAGQHVNVKSRPEKGIIIFEFPDAQQLPLLKSALGDKE